MTIVGCINACFIGDQTLEKLPEPAQVGRTKVGGIDLNQPRMRCVAEAVLALSASPAGFTASELARQIHSMTGQPESGYGPRRAAYDLKKLRAKGMVSKIGKSRRYEPAPEGLRSLTALLVLREKSSGCCWPPPAGRSHPQNQPIPRPSITTTKASGLGCAVSSPSLVSPLEHRQFIFHPFG